MTVLLGLSCVLSAPIGDDEVVGSEGTRLVEVVLGVSSKIK